MNPNKQENTDPQLNKQFSDDLKALFEPAQPVRPEVDRAIMDLAARQLPRRNARPHLIRWVGFAASAAAAVLLGILLLNPNKPTQPAPTALRNDINRDGTVDILDAYKLARNIESTHPVDPQWDINGDGLVDQRDVDTIAMASVKLNEGVL